MNVTFGLGFLAGLLLALFGFGKTFRKMKSVRLLLCAAFAAAVLSGCAPDPERRAAPVPAPVPRPVRQPALAPGPVKPIAAVQKLSAAQPAPKNQKAANDWAVQLLAAINRKWVLPYRTNQRLAISVAVTINSAGAVQLVSFRTSSGDQVYDNSIAQAIYRASPLPLPRDPSVFRSKFSICIGANLHGCK